MPCSGHDFCIQSDTVSTELYHSTLLLQCSTSLLQSHVWCLLTSIGISLGRRTHRKNSWRINMITYTQITYFLVLKWAIVFCLHLTEEGHTDRQTLQTTGFLKTCQLGALTGTLIYIFEPPFVDSTSNEVGSFKICL